MFLSFFWFATIARVPNLSAVETFPENVDPQHSQKSWEVRAIDENLKE
jgi:hypothetical protein